MTSAGPQDKSLLGYFEERKCSSERNEDLLHTEYKSVNCALSLRERA